MNTRNPKEETRPIDVIGSAMHVGRWRQGWGGQAVSKYKLLP